MRAALVCGLLALSFLTPAFGEEPVVVYQPELPEGYPWKMGEGTVSLDGAARSYTTFDFSIGAFDAAVQFRKDYDCSGSGSCKDTGKVLLTMTAHPDGNSEAENDVVTMRGLFSRVPNGPKKARDVTIQIRDVDGQDGAYLMSKGPAKFALTAIKRGKDGSDSYGTFSATVSGTVCEATEEALIPGGACQEFKATFTTEVQYDSV